MRKKVLAAALAVVATLLFAPMAQAGADHVTMCHRTGSATNPYVQISPSAAGVYNGHLDHNQVGNGLGGDIIPVFTYQGNTYSKNLDTNFGHGVTGADILANDCKVPSSTPPPPPPPIKCAETLRFDARMVPNKDGVDVTKGFDAVKGDTIYVTIRRAPKHISVVVKDAGVVVFSRVVAAKPHITTVRVRVAGLDVQVLARAAGKPSNTRTYTATATC